ncbi:MAG: hypothetical protein ACK53Y_07610 [bacterium]
MLEQQQPKETNAPLEVVENTGGDTTVFNTTKKWDHEGRKNIRNLSNNKNLKNYRNTPGSH